MSIEQQYKKAQSLRRAGEIEAAAALFKRNIEARLVNCGLDANVLRVRRFYGGCLYDLGKYSKAEVYHRETLRGWVQLGGVDGKTGAARIRPDIVKSMLRQYEDSDVDSDLRHAKYIESRNLLLASLQDFTPHDIPNTEFIYVLQLLAEVSNNLAEEEEELDHDDAAADLYREALSHDREALKRTLLNKPKPEDLIAAKYRVAQDLFNCWESLAEARALFHETLKYIEAQKTQTSLYCDLRFPGDDCELYLKATKRKERIKVTVDKWRRSSGLKPPQSPALRNWVKLLKKVLVCLRVDRTVESLCRIVQDHKLLDEYTRRGSHRFWSVSYESKSDKGVTSFLGVPLPNQGQGPPISRRHGPHQSAADMDSDVIENGKIRGSFFDTYYNKPTRESKEWIIDYSNFSTAVRKYTTDDTVDIKVAVLDTGIDGSHPFIKKKWKRDRLVEGGYRNFVEDRESLEEPCDNDGHGTHCAGIILQFAPKASLYVARIASSKQSCQHDANFSKRILEALDWVINKIGVNVVSMSFGLESEDEHISTKIHNAAIKTTFLAAAANQGNRRVIAYPARHKHVFCIHACNGNGKPSDFTPQAEPRYGDNYSILGEGVPSTWPMHLPASAETIPATAKRPGHWKHSSGTSVATPLAASLVANMLAYCLDHFPDDKQMYYDRVEKIMSSMSRKESGYFNLVPWLGQDGKFRDYEDEQWFETAVKCSIMPKRN